MRVPTYDTGLLAGLRCARDLLMSLEPEPPDGLAHRVGTYRTGYADGMKAALLACTSDNRGVHYAGIRWTDEARRVRDEIEALCEAHTKGIDR